MKKEKLSCKVIQDLLPLYEDNCCSEDSKKLVEEHLKTCEDCKNEASVLGTKITSPEVAKIHLDEKIIKKGIRKLKHFHYIGIVALTICLLIIFAVIPIVNYKVGNGITYSNLNELYNANKFIGAIKDKNYEKAYECLGIEENYEQLINKDYSSSVAEGINQIRENGFEWYDKTCKDKFLENMKELENNGYSIKSYTYKGIFRQLDGWEVDFIVEAEDGTSFELKIIINHDGIIEFSPMMSAENIYGESELETNPVNIYLSDHYIMPNLNETVIAIIYKGSDFDWTVLFNHEYK